MHVLQTHWRMVQIGVGARGDGAPIATGVPIGVGARGDGDPIGTGFQLDWARAAMGTQLLQGSN